MKNFCEGILWGMLAGVCIGAAVVAKNKKLSKKIRDGLEVTEEKIAETKEALEEKLTDSICEYGSCGEKSQNNNFSKKNKNC